MANSVNVATQSDSRPKIAISAKNKTGAGSRMAVAWFSTEQNGKYLVKHKLYPSPWIRFRAITHHESVSPEVSEGGDLAITSNARMDVKTRMAPKIRKGFVVTSELIFSKIKRKPSRYFFKELFLIWMFFIRLP